MAQAIVKKTISKDDKEIADPISAQDQVPEVSKPQVLVNLVGVNLIESRSPEKDLKKLIKKSKLNAKYLENLISMNNYKGMLDAKLIGARNSMLNF
jgi:hypothetical protein